MIHALMLFVSTYLSLFSWGSPNGGSCKDHVLFNPFFQPSAGVFSSALNGIGGSGASDIWAVGMAGSSQKHSLIEH